jgi:hypothetical protein
MINKHPGRFDTEVLRDMPLHGYIIVFVGPIILICAKKCHIVCAVGRGAEGGDLGEAVYIIDLNPLPQLVSSLFF